MFDACLYSFLSPIKCATYIVHVSGIDGAVGVSLDKPGLGIEVDEEAVRRFTVPRKTKGIVLKSKL